LRAEEEREGEGRPRGKIYTAFVKGRDRLEQADGLAVAMEKEIITETVSGVLEDRVPIEREKSTKSWDDVDISELPPRRVTFRAPGV